MKQISVTVFRVCRFGLVAGAMIFAAAGAPAFAAGSAKAKENTDFSAQSRPARPQIRVQPPVAWPYPRPDTYAWPGPGAVRQCDDWYAVENRPSGKVVTPQMRCRWVRR